MRSLAAHMDHLNSRLTFSMDTTIGLVGIEQNQIIKMLSVVAVMLMRPTLIASVYGMNFAHMPELQFVWAYPAAIVATIVSAVFPFLYFSRKGWL
ncbi:MAG: CorA family divalent cation transporter [Hyphomicrobiaceae bacterium]